MGATVPAIEMLSEEIKNLLKVLTALCGASLVNVGRATKAKLVKRSRFSCTICTLTTEGGGL